MNISDRLVDNLIDEIVAIELADAGALLDAVERGRRAATPLQYRKAARRALSLMRKYGQLRRVARAVQASRALSELAENLAFESVAPAAPVAALLQSLRQVTR